MDPVKILEFTKAGLVWNEITVALTGKRIHQCATSI